MTSKAASPPPSREPGVLAQQDQHSQAAIIAFLVIFVMLGFPSSGGAISPVLLPTFWHVLNRFWIGADAFDAFRTIIYFGGQGVGADVFKLLA